MSLGERVAPTDIEEGMRVGVDRTKYQIQIPLPPKIDPSVTMMQVEEKPDVTYGDVGGCKEQIEKLREVVELPLLSPERFVNLGIDPPKVCCSTARPVRARRCVLEPGEPNRRHLYPRHRLRAGAKVRRRWREDGARAL